MSLDKFEETKIKNEEKLFSNVLDDNNIDNIIKNNSFFSNTNQIQNLISKYEEGEIKKIKEFIESLPPYLKIILQSIFQLLEESSTNNLKYIDFKEISKNKKEEELYEKINLYVHKKLHIKKKGKNYVYCKYYKNIETLKINKEELNKLILENNNLLQIKGIIFSIYNLIIEYMRSYFNSNYDLNEKIEEEDISEKNLNYLKFQDIYDDFVQIGNWTSDIETDFNEVFNKFKLEKNIEFKLSEFSLDLFLNSIFRIKQINFSFLKNYINNKEQKIVNNSINKILNALSKMNYPFKINICKILDISHLIEKEEKYDLISLICKKKIKLYNEPIKNNINEDINHMKNIREKKDKKQEIQLLKIQEQLLKNFGEEITENNNNNNKEEDLEKKEKENLEEIKEKNNKEEQKEIIKEYKTFQEWLDYIIDDSVVTPKNKKKNKKNKKQNENENNKIIEIYDPIVDEFKQNILNDNNDKNNKIKPVFSKEFLKKISNNFFK